MNTRPFALLKAALDPRFPLHSLVMFDQDGRPLVGFISGTKKERYLVTAGPEKVYELSENRLHKLPGGFPETVETDADRLEYLLKLQSAPEFLDIPKLWENALANPKDIWSETELYKLIFDSIDLNSYISLRTALIVDRVYFARDQKGFIPRSPDVIENLKQTEILRKEKEELRHELGAFIKSRQKDRTREIPPKLLPLLTLLSETAARNSSLSTQDIAEAEEIIQTVEAACEWENSGTVDARAYGIALKAGALRRDSNLSLIRHRIPVSFSSESLDEARSLTLPETVSEYQDVQIRQDLTHLDAFTIDDSSTKDMDDALSLERTDSGYRLGIHIIDISYAIKKDSKLDGEAFRRATSIYCPDINIDMFPEVLSHDRLSLRANVLRPCVSCLVEIDRNFKPTSADIRPSIVSVKRRLSYTEADEMLFKEDPILTIINNITGVLEQQRIEQGALRVMKRDVMPVLSKDSITLQEVDEHAPSRNLIGEMMVLANTIMANFLHTHSIPALYRTQDKPDSVDPGHYQSIPAGPAREHFERTRLKRSVVQLSPGYHATLGLSAYVQMTSPIRRYLDLCLQRQLMSYFREEKPPYSAGDLQHIQSQIEEPLQKAIFASRESKKYWILRYLERYVKEGKSISGIVVRADNKVTLVELDEVFITVHARLNRPRLGDRVNLKIVHIDPRTDYIRLEEKRKTPR